MDDTIEFIQVVIPFPQMRVIQQLFMTIQGMNVDLDHLINSILTAFNNYVPMLEILTMVEDYTLPLEENFHGTRISINSSLTGFIGMVQVYIVQHDLILPFRTWNYEIDAIRILMGGFDDHTEVTQNSGYY